MKAPTQWKSSEGSCADPPAFWRVARRTKHKFKPASKKDLALLKELKLPGKVLEFYAQHEPHYTSRKQAPATLCLFGIQEILAEMKMMEPAATMAPFGYGPLAENGYGDMYLYDLNHIGADGWPQIVFASHEAIGGPDDTKETVEDALGEGAPNLPQFLRMAAEGELEEPDE